MLKTDKDYFFLVEDNCKVLDDQVYEKFIETSEATGIHALMWARGGINKRIGFDEDRYIQYYTDFVSSFSMFTRKAVEKVGFFDEKMPPNTWQELEYAKRIGDVELGTPFGLFAAPRGVDQYFEITTPKDEFKNLKQMEEALQYWESKDLEDFPIDVKRNKEVMRVQPITEMI